MSLYVHGLAPWEINNDYYSNVQLGKDVRAQAETISKSTKDMVAAQMASTSAIISSQDRISEGIDNLSYGIDRVEQGISGLQAAFEWGISQVVWQIEQNREILKGILEVLSAPLDTQAKELRKRAEQAYANGWFEDALEDFFESERKNRYDFSIHISIGMIYLFQIIDKQKALGYFDKAIKYARPNSAYHTSFALLHKGLIKRDLGLLDEAEKCAAEALQLSPDLSEAFYQCAQYNAILNKSEKAVSLLRRAIKLDVNYCEKISTEKDFAKIKDDINRLFNQLQEEEGESARKNLANAENKIGIYNDLLKEIKAHESIDVQDGEIQKCINRIRELINRNSYRDSLEANKLIKVLPSLYRNLSETIKTQLNSAIYNYSTDSSNLTVKKTKRVGIYQGIIAVAWVGVILSFISGIKGCIQDIVPGTLNGFGTFFYNFFWGIVITAVIYFFLRLLVRAIAATPPAKVGKNNDSIDRARNFMNKLDVANI
jgi:tetratricopeptide (TPR) repeat protein